MKRDVVTQHALVWIPSIVVAPILGQQHRQATEMKSNLIKVTQFYTFAFSFFLFPYFTYVIRTTIQVTTNVPPPTEFTGFLPELLCIAVSVYAGMFGILVNSNTTRNVQCYTLQLTTPSLFQSKNY